MNHFKPTSFTLILLLFISCYFSATTFAQENPENVITYDLVYLKNGQVLKGEILVFEEKDGDITFKDSFGRKYSITREEYDYFVEDKRYFVNKKDTLSIKPRKTNEFEISLGFNLTVAMVNETIKEDNAFHGQNAGGFAYIPTCFQFGLGKYINRQNFIGLSGDFGLIGGVNNYFSFGLRYMYQYDSYKRNVSFYVPLELQFNNINYTSYYYPKDSVSYDGGLTYYQLTVDNISSGVSINSINFNVGQGFSFMLNNKKSISLELKLFKSFILSNKFIDLEGNKPKSNYKINGIKLALFYNI